MQSPQIMTIKLENQDAINSFLTLKLKYKDAFFFESNSIDQTANLSIIGLNRYESVRLKANQVEVETSSGTQIINQDFLSVVGQKLKSLEQKRETIPYAKGGAFGCLGYELIAHIEPKLKQSGYFKAVEETAEPEAEIFFCRNLVVFEHQKKLIHFILTELDLSIHCLVSSPELNKPPRSVTDVSYVNFKPSMGKEKFLASVATLKEHIKAGDIFQAVLSERFERVCNVPALKLFATAKKVCPSAYSFYFDFKASSYFGFSPEVFLKIENNILETHPIAGTMPRGENEQADQANAKCLNESIKEGAEHLMLVDLARNDLGRVATPGSVKVQEFRKVLYLSNVMHLVSIVTANIAPDQSNLDAFKSCFPAGTLSGAPKIRAMEILSTLEKQPRGFYGGAMVAFDHTGDLDSCIAIRSVEIKNGKAILRAGAGIVADSNPESEYQEIEHKLKALVQAIDVAHENAQREQVLT